MPPPGDTGPARIEKHISDPVWDVFYAPVAGAVWRLSEVLNHCSSSPSAAISASSSPPW